jgi:hypothetical protein
MDADVVRLLIRRRLQDGRLPHGRIGEVWFQAGNGQPCDCCGDVITPNHTKISGVSLDEWAAIQFHADCFRIWEVERLVSVPTS